MPDADPERQSEEAQLDEHIALAAALKPLIPDVARVGARISRAPDGPSMGPRPYRAPTCPTEKGKALTASTRRMWA